VINIEKTGIPDQKNNATAILICLHSITHHKKDSLGKRVSKKKFCVNKLGRLAMQYHFLVNEMGR